MKGIQVCSNEGPWPFPRGDNNEIAKIHWWNFKIFFSRTTWPISTKLGTKHPWLKGIQDRSKVGPRPFPRGDNYEIAKIHWRNNLKIFFSRTTEPISTKFLQMKGLALFQGEIITKWWKHIDQIKKKFSRTTEPISTKPGTMHPWVKGIIFCSNKGPRPFQRGDNYENVKIHWWN